MEEKIIDKELEKIINEINKNIQEKLFSEKDNEVSSLEIVGNNAVFYGQFWKKACSIPEFKPLFDYLDKEGYKYKLD